MYDRYVSERSGAADSCQGRNKVYGVTSVLVQAFFTVEYLFDVNEKSFQPPPKVKSAVIRLWPLAERLIAKK